jgi:uncharacterized membrane protein YgdD (TMEM256/DUF423 family)
MPTTTPSLRLAVGLAGASGVALGALGAHAWRPVLEAASRVDVWETAVLYHLVHAVAAWVVVVGREHPGRWAVAAAWCWMGGILAFSGSLYALALGGAAWLGPVTSLGGLALIAGWICGAIRFTAPSRHD